MKTRIAFNLIALSVALAATSCVGPSPFTADPDPVTGIRQDIPRNPDTGEKLWADADPLDTPGTDSRAAANHPLLTWQGRSEFFFGIPGSGY